MKIEETKQAISAAKAGRFVFVPNLPNSDMICTTDDLKALAADHTRLVEALKYYANPETHKFVDYTGRLLIEYPENANVAIKALEGK